ncbi:Protein couch potato, partial [Fragariocoptes setiger]
MTSNGESLLSHPLHPNQQQHLHNLQQQNMQQQANLQRNIAQQQHHQKRVDDEMLAIQRDANSNVRTLFVSGLPMDAKPRELYLLFRGYKV